MASIDQKPMSLSQFQLFRKSQFKTKIQKPPASTSLSGQTAIITGSNQGIGFECARHFLNLGISHLILAVRSREKGEIAAGVLRKEHRNARIDVWALDMLSYESVQTFAQNCESNLSRLDVVVLNAGLAPANFEINRSTGHERTIQTNYLSTAFLAILMLPILKSKSKASPHLMITASALGIWSKFENRDADPLIPSFDNGKGWGVAAAAERYNVSKTLVLMLVYKLSTLVSADDVIINCVEPGYTKGTGLAREVPTLAKPIIKLMEMTGRTPSDAALTYVDAAVVKGKESHGCFVMNWEIYPFHPMMYTQEGRTTMERLWAETMKEFQFANVENILSSMQKSVL